MRRLKPSSNLIIPPGLTAAAADKDRTWPTGDPEITEGIMITKLGKPRAGVMLLS